MTNIMRSTRHKSSLNKQRLHNRNIKENKIQSILNTVTSHRLMGLNPYKPEVYLRAFKFKVGEKVGEHRSERNETTSSQLTDTGEFTKDYYSLL